ncbi:helix-turn-helix domain-containing protein [Paenibacillus sp. MB22_1]|uniref:helix-turn-helix domain-containing protein n=1 Tax=Paenibacillus sp. MB22_1 TaxID=3383121 RepID=UPI00399F6249
MLKITRSELYKIRKALGLTLDEMGALINVSGPQLHYIERGNRRLKTEHIALLTRELDLTPERLARLLAVYDAEESADTLKERARHKLAKIAR